MKIIAIALLSLSLSVHAQTTTNTNCNISGNTANCNSTTYDQSSSNAALQQTQQQNYQTGQQVGAALGGGVASMIQRHRINKYCKHHQGEEWVLRNSLGQVMGSGICPTH